MKKAIFFLLVATGAFTANAQALKDLLYSGKLKTDSNSVVRKTDDLSTKIDTTTKKPVEQAKAGAATSTDSSVKKIITPTDSAATVATTDAPGTTASTAPDNSAVTKNNNKIWKEFVDSVASTVKAEVLPSKKIKKDTYYILVEYEIGADGQVSINNVTSTPGNDFLQDQVKSRLVVGSPTLTPALDSNNKPRKVKKKYTFNITKE